MSMYMTYRTYENKPKELPEEKEKIETKKKQFAMYIKQGDNYVEYHGDEGKENLFPEGYKLNEEQSRCEDIDGNKIEDISFDTNTNSITVTSNKTAYCYLYFDIKTPENPQELIDSRTSNESLSDEEVGGMYRYQGSSVNNYICLGSLNNTNCQEKTDNMYRIIGITPEGNIKVMKQTSIGNYAWNTKYHDDSSSSSGYCGRYGCPEWPNSEIYQTLNENADSFLSKLSDDIKNKIADWEWYYGDIEYNYANKTANQIYNIEIGQTNTQYYGKTASNKNLVTGQKWVKMNNKAKIGLIYLHDYYYQSTSDNCLASNNTYTQCKDNGWMHISKNDIHYLVTKYMNGPCRVLVDSLTRVLSSVRGMCFRTAVSTPGTWALRMRFARSSI